MPKRLAILCCSLLLSSCDSSNPDQPAGSFAQHLALQGIGFQINSSNQGSLNQLHILPSGLSVANTAIQREIDGSVSGAEVADLNADGAPELYVFVTSAGSGSSGSLVAFAANQNKSLSEIYLPPLTDNPPLMQGYMGHDQLSIGDGILVRRFPLYRPDDVNAAPSGGSREIHYQLLPGEAGWQLKVVHSVDSPDK